VPSGRLVLAVLFSGALIASRDVLRESVRLLACASAAGQRAVGVWPLVPASPKIPTLSCSALARPPHCCSLSCAHHPRFELVAAVDDDPHAQRAGKLQQLPVPFQP